MKVILMGYMGSGKSSVGKKLAETLGFPFKDLDAEIEQTEGMSISHLFSNKGEIYFRKRENAVLKELLSKKGDFVLSTGGGTPCYADSLEYMLKQQDTVSVYLKSSINTLSKRLFSEKSKRPVLAHLQTENDLLDFVRKHLFERSHYYAQADITINVDDISVKEAVEKILLKLF